MLATPMTPQASHPSSSNMTTISSRPKLTLQTTSLPRTFGTSSTGLSLSIAAGTASPTVRNTFKNAYEVTGPSSATASPSSKHPSNLRFSKPSSPFTTHNPYQLPLGVKSILRNSPLEPTCRRRAGSVATTGPNGGPSARRVFFPAKKQVSYRNPLEEEIQTVHYTARHSDLHDDPEPALEPQSQPQQPEVTSSDEDSDSNASGCPSDTSTSEDEPETGLGKTTSSPIKRKKRKHSNAERQVRAVALMDGIAGPSNPDSLTPQTPRRKRAKRRCEWRWTLGPLENRDKLLHPVQDETGPTSSASQPETIPHESETETPSSDPPLSSASTTLYHSSPSSSVSSDVETENDEWQTHTTHELECAHADQ
ncbi:NADH oxidoreductase (quinone), F subunit [Aspergillus niger]|uniref:NADH oxidoreductase (Quinone), F subunit n=1 Tax=Aspergillus niger TaxID=5061 RepID=A0A505HXB6_ASPNG|nr:NADH oxidoreductase (quinone), F subunit [Aspergillus niger]